MTQDGAWLVVGADSTIGKALLQTLSASEYPSVGTTRRSDSVAENRLWLDLTRDPYNWPIPGDVSTAVLCAGITSLEECRREPVHAWIVNVEHTARLAERLAKSGAFVIGLSTNLVFPGDFPQTPADAPRDPRCEYGRQKAALEEHLEQLGKHAAVVRMTKVVGPGSRLFSTWRDRLLAAQPIRPFRNVRFSPISLSLVVTALLEIGRQRRGGVWQISAECDITWEQAARHIANRCGVPSGLIEPIDAAERGIEYEWIPQHTTLDTSRLRRELKLEPTDAFSVIDESLGIRKSTDSGLSRRPTS